MPVPSLVVRMMSDTSSMLSAKLEKEVLRGISDAAAASGKYTRQFKSDKTTFYRVSDACIITSSYKEDTISQLMAEVIYKSRVKNPEINFRAIGVGKWGNIHDPITIEARFDSVYIVKNKNICPGQSVRAGSGRKDPEINGTWKQY
jgi:hypothetical protein